jgi:hypothetical protein
LSTSQTAVALGISGVRSMGLQYLLMERALPRPLTP